jgi:hypothetical protein
MPQRYRVSAPPPTDPYLHQWFLQVQDALNQLPNISIVSTTNGPSASNITGVKGDIVVDIGSSTTAAWIKREGSKNTGWIALDRFPAQSGETTAEFSSVWAAGVWEAMVWEGDVWA